MTPRPMSTIHSRAPGRRARRMLPIACIALLCAAAAHASGRLDARADDAADDAAAADPAAEPAPLGQLGGATRAIAVAPGGRTLWIGYGPRLAMVDVANGAAPRLAAVSAVLPEVVEAVAVDGDAVFATAGAVLYRFAAGDFAANDFAGGGDTVGGDAVGGNAPVPDAAAFVADVAGGEVAAEVVVQGGAVYVLTGRWRRGGGGTDRLEPAHVAVVAVGGAGADGTDPPLAVVAADILPPGTMATDIALTGRRLFVASSLDASLSVGERPGRLVVYDARAPQAPRVVGALDGRAWSDELATPSMAGGPPVLVGLGADLMTLRFDAAGRAWQGAFEADVGGRGFMGARGSSLVATASGRVFAAYNGGYAVGGISSPTRGGGSLSFEGIPSGGAAAFGERLFASERGGRLHVIDHVIDPVIDPIDGDVGGDASGDGGMLVATGRLDLVGEVASVAVDGRRPGQLVVAVNQGGVASIDVTDAGAARPAGWRVADYAFDGHYRRDADVQDGVAVVIDGGNADLFGATPDLFTVDAAGHVSRTASIDHFWFGAAYARVGTTLYASDTTAEDSLDSAIAVWDIADPAAPRLVQRLPVDGEVKGLAVGAGRLVVPWIHVPEVPADPDDPFEEIRLEVFDLAVPLAPSVLGTIDPTLRRVAWGPSAIELSGRHALIDWERETGPDSSARLLSAVDLSGAVPGVAHGVHWPAAIGGELIGAADGFAFVRPTCRYTDPVDPVHLRVIDAADPLSPRSVWQATLPGVCSADRGLDVAVHAGTLYVAAGHAGLYAYRPPLAWRPDGTPPSATATPATSEPPPPIVTAPPWPTPGGPATPPGTIEPLPAPIVPWNAYVPIASRR